MTPDSKKAAQGRATRSALLAAARDAFGERGYADTSIDEIVRRSGVTKGAFYHHFSNKEELFLHVFEAVKKEVSRSAFITHLADPRADSASVPRQIRTTADQSSGEVWRDLIACCRRFIELHTDAVVRRIALVDARSVLRRDDWQRVESEHGPVLLRADLRRAMNRGLIQRLPLRPLATILTGALSEACLLVANAADQPAALDEAMDVIERLLDGLRTGASEHGG